MNRSQEGPCIGPLSQCGLDEALGLSVGPWRIGLGFDVLEAEGLAGVFEGVGFVAGSVVGHDPLHGDPEASVVGECSLQEGDLGFGPAG